MCRQHKYRIQSSRWATKEPVLMFKLSSLRTPSPHHHPRRPSSQSDWEVRQAFPPPFSPQQQWVKMLVHLTLKTVPGAAARGPTPHFFLLREHLFHTFFFQIMFTLLAHFRGGNK